MKKVRIALILMALMSAIIITITSCENPIDSSVQYGSLSVDVSDDGSRTIQPETCDLAFSKYRIYGSHKEHSELTVDQEFTTPSVQINDLVTGEWTFKVEGYNDSGELIATSDEEIVDIEVNGITNKTYTLNWLTGGEGTLNLSVSVQTSQTEKVECVLENTVDGSMTTLTLTSRSVKNGMFVFSGSFSVSTGFYNTTITMKDADGNQLGTVLRPSVHIYRNLTSSYEFSWEKFKNFFEIDAPRASAENNGTIDCNSTITLITLETDTDIYYSFDGSSFTKYDSGVRVTLYADSDTITLYAYAVKDRMKQSEVASYTYSVRHVGMGTPEYTWTATSSGYDCYGLIPCSYHATRTTKTETVTATKTITSNPTCTVAGRGIYTALFTDSGFTAQTRDFIIPTINHEYLSEIVDSDYLKSEATCTESAVFCKSCSMCGKASSTETFKSGDPLGHDTINHEAQASTCTVQGWDAYITCSRCDYTTKELLPLIAHNAVEVVNSTYLRKSATCTESAVYSKSCSMCGKAFEDTFKNGDSLGHDYVSHDAKAATCTDAGWNAYQTCSRCDYTTYKEIEAFGHDYVENVASDYLVSAATCTESAVYYKSCSRCGLQSAETFKSGEPLGHDTVNHEAQASTCTVQGWDAYVTCSRCDYTTKELLPLIAHNAVEVVTLTYLKKSATCTESAVYSKSCSMCGKVFEDTFKNGDPLGHDYVSHDARAATCTDAGWNAYQTCSRCDYTTYKEIEAFGHDYVEKVASDYLVSVATCTESAVYYKSCSRCGLQSAETFKSGEPLGHDYVNHDAKEPTCTDVGWSAYQTCSRCDYTTYSEIKELGHDFVLKLDSAYLFSAATCTDCAWYYKSCSRCSLISEQCYGSGEPLGHDLITHEAKNSTCTEQGWNEYQSCTRCSYTTIHLLPYNHEPIEVVDTEYLRSGASCSEPASYYKICSLCNTVLDETFSYGSSLGHNYVDYQCNRCKEWTTGPTGGYVFYDCDADNNEENNGAGPDGLKSSECKWRFLEAASEDLEYKYQFGYYRPEGPCTVVGTSTSIGTGKANTEALVKAMGEVTYSSYTGTSTAKYAAKECDSYSIEVNGIVYDDWFLPSRDELNLMFENLRKNGLSVWMNQNYWTSSEYYDYCVEQYAWRQDFYNGYYSYYCGVQGGSPRDNWCYVRPVRVFL